MVLTVPHFSTNSICDNPFSILGFGDILVPGLFDYTLKLYKFNPLHMIINVKIILSD